jgi:TonB family protein
MHDYAAPIEPEGGADATPRPRRLSAYLVTADISLWTEMGGIGDEWTAKQVDSVDELVAAVPVGEEGVVLWDARGCRDSAAVLSRIQLHSECFAVIALGDASSSAEWALPVEQRQVVAFLPLPLDGWSLTDALKRGLEEINARAALLQQVTTAAAARPQARRSLPWKPIALAAVVLGAAAAGPAILRHGVTLRQDVPPSTAKGPATAPAPVSSGPKEAAKSNSAADERVDSLVEAAQRAMLARHYLDPVEDSALTLYREVLVLDPSNGEANQGLHRLAEVLIAKVQTALDERRIDIALQALETARSLGSDDHRIAELDARIAALRGELGPAQIQAALNAQSFDRALQLIDEAGRAHTLSVAELGQLRDDVRRRRDEVELSRLVTLIDARLKQNRLSDPANDSAAFYLNQVQHRFPESPAWQAEYQEFLKLSAKAAPAAERPAQSPLLELARTRLGQGNLTEPENDSALYYVNQLRAADAQNAGLAPLSAALQSRILERARAALDAANLAAAEALARQAADLGASADVDAFNGRLRQARADAGSASERAVPPPEYAENSLIRSSPLKPQYPHAALVRGLEGWVEVGYTVTAAGKVADVKTLDASPAGVFDAAAKEAVARMSYKPIQADGKPIAVQTKLRVAFRLSSG